MAKNSIQKWKDIETGEKYQGFFLGKNPHDVRLLGRLTGNKFTEEASKKEVENSDLGIYLNREFYPFDNYILKDKKGNTHSFSDKLFNLRFTRG